MRAHLNWPVARVRDGELNERPVRVELDVGALHRHHFSRWTACDRGPSSRRSAEDSHIRRGEEAATKGLVKVTILGRYRAMDGEQLRAVGESAFDLHLGDHRRDAWQHLPDAKEPLSQGHELRDADTVPDALLHLARDQCDSLGVVQAKPARKPALCQLPGLREAEVIDLPRGQPHATPGAKVFSNHPAGRERSMRQKPTAMSRNPQHRREKKS
mmetsp:Transcript_86435/g.241859  ORF Transcript_86435/g.241859 Transcript_86435/m.241859 type:complete len:214 (-) Transcript_86435:38-679(-)